MTLVFIHGLDKVVKQPTTPEEALQLLKCDYFGNPTKTVVGIHEIADVVIDDDDESEMSAHYIDNARLDKLRKQA